MAGQPLDKFLFPGSDGASMSHLRGQFEDPAERIHRARPIRHRVCVSGGRDVDRFDFHLAQRKTTETLIMVSLIEMPQTLPQQLPRQTDGPADETEGTVMINVD